MKFTIIIIVWGFFYINTVTAQNQSFNPSKINPENLESWLKNQSIPKDDKVVAVGLIEERFKFFSLPTKQKALDLLEKYNLVEADKLLVDLALSGGNSFIGRTTVKSLKKRLNPACRKYIIEKTKSASPNIMKKMIPLVKQLENLDLIEDFIDDLEKDLNVNVDSNRTNLDLNYNSKEFAGYTNYSNTAKIGKKRVHNNIRMPRHKSLWLQTKVTINSAQVLKLATGKNYGYDITKWRIWLLQQQNKQKH